MHAYIRRYIDVRVYACVCLNISWYVNIDKFKPICTCIYKYMLMQICKHVGVSCPKVGPMTITMISMNPMRVRSLDSWRRRLYNATDLAYWVQQWLLSTECNNGYLVLSAALSAPKSMPLEPAPWKLSSGQYPKDATTASQEGLRRDILWFRSLCMHVYL